MSVTSAGPRRCSGAGSAIETRTRASTSVTGPGKPTRPTRSGSTRRARRSSETPSTAFFPTTSGGPGRFSWPPPKENYVWGSLGPAFVEAELLQTVRVRRRVPVVGRGPQARDGLAPQRGSVPRAGRRRVCPVDRECRLRNGLSGARAHVGKGDGLDRLDARHAPISGSNSPPVPAPTPSPTPTPTSSPTPTPTPPPPLPRPRPPPHRRRHPQPQAAARQVCRPARMLR